MTRSIRIVERTWMRKLWGFYDLQFPFNRKGEIKKHEAARKKKDKIES